MLVFKKKGLDEKFSSARQDWGTPPTLFAPINAEFQFTLDAAASKENALVSKFFSADDDGLKQDWGSEIVWVNPPFGDRTSALKNWVKKSYEASISGATVVMLIPARTNTVWFHDICIKYGEVRFIRGRPKFIGCKHGLPQPLCFVIFRPATS